MRSIHADRLLPMLDNVILDLRSLERVSSLPKDKNRSFQDKYTFWKAAFAMPITPDGSQLNNFVDYLKNGGLEPKTICLSPGSTSIEDTVRLIGYMCSSTVILHDFGTHEYNDGLPCCDTLIVDFHSMIYVVTPDHRLSALRTAFYDDEGRPRRRDISRVLFTRSPWPKLLHTGIVNDNGQDHSADEKERLSEGQVYGRLHVTERDAVFEEGVNELLKSGSDWQGEEVRKLAWGYLTQEKRKTRCRGCDRKSIFQPHVQDTGQRTPKIRS